VLATLKDYFNYFNLITGKIYCLNKYLRIAAVHLVHIDARSFHVSMNDFKSPFFMRCGTNSEFCFSVANLDVAFLKLNLKF